MRRQRHVLQVNTFPFLAVLLCAMGSLILLLMVIDRRAKIAARAKAQQAAIEIAADRTKAAADRQAEWEQKCRQLHELLAGQDRALKIQLSNLQEKNSATSRRLQEEEAGIQDVEKAISQQKANLNQLRTDLALRRGTLNRASQQEKGAQKELAGLARELAELEMTLLDLQALRRREQETYSLVPYLGRHGDTRRPLYVECTALGLVFHPDKRIIPAPSVSEAEMRVEVERRAGKLPLKPKSEANTDWPAAASNAYLLFLVRPDGINTYYQAQEAIHNLAIDFGYEFVEADWALDFSSEERIASQPSIPGPQIDPNGGPFGMKSRARSSQGSYGGGLLAQGTGQGSFGAGHGGETGSPGSSGSQAGSRQGQGFPGVSQGGGVPSPGPLGNAGSGNQGQGFPGDQGGPVANPWPSGNPGSGNQGQGFPGGGQGGGVASRWPLGNAGSGNQGQGFPGVSQGGGVASPWPLWNRGSGVQSQGFVDSVGRGPAQHPAGNGLTASGPGQALNEQGTGPGQLPYSPGVNGLGQGQGGLRPEEITFRPSLPWNRAATGGSGNSQVGPGSSLSVPSAIPAPPEYAGGGNPRSPAGTNVALASPTAQLDAATGPWKARARAATNPGVLDSGQQGTGSGGDGPGLTGQSGTTSGNQSFQSPGSPSNQPNTASASRQNKSALGTGRAQSGSGAYEGGEGQELAGGQSFGLPSPLASLQKPEKTVLRPLPLSRIVGNRDFVMVLECTADAVVLEPWGKRFALSSLPNRPDPNHELVRTIKALVARRQATVRSGEPAYRPTIRFQIRPDGLRAFYLSYPLLEGLRIPMTREKSD